MFSWLESKPDHPMFNAEEAKLLLAELPKDQPLKALEDVIAWLGSFRGTPGFRLEPRIAVAMLLDQTGRQLCAKLLKQYLSEPHLQDFRGIRLWQTIHTFTQEMAETYALCVDEYRREKSPSEEVRENITVVCVRLLRTRAEQMKLELMRYQDLAQEIWEGMYRYYRFAEESGLADVMVTAYPGNAIHTSPRHELLHALALSQSSPETLAPDQIEVASRIAARMVSFFGFTDKPDDACPYFIDLEHPMAPGHAGKEPELTPGMRFFGMAKAIPRLEEIAEQNEHGVLSEERRFGNEFTPDGKLTVLKHLQQYWGGVYLHRLQERRNIHAEIEVVHGFKTISKLVAHIELDQVVGLSADEVSMLKQRSAVGLAEVEEKYTSESWLVQDLSTSGLGGMMPQVAGSWAKIGALCGLKGRNAGQWWVGMIRRLKTDSRNKVHAGIEILTKKPLSVWLRALGRGVENAANWETSSGSFDYDYLPVILLPDAQNSYANATMLMETGSYVPEAMFEVMMGEKSRNIKLAGLLAEGDDYEQVKFEWLDAE